MARTTTTRPEINAQKPYLDGVAKNLADKLYGPNGPPRGTLFDDLEELAVQLSRVIARELISRALERQAATQSGEAPGGDELCPTCREPGSRAEPEPRLVTTRVGDAAWDEPRRHCDRCRRSFFPPIPRPGD